MAGFAPLADYPYMADMARLEWALHLSHYAAGAPALGAADLVPLDPVQLEVQGFVLHPAGALYASRWATVGLWLAHQAEGPVFPEEMAVPGYCVVVRPDWRSGVLAPDRVGYLALQRLAAGATFGEALDTAFEVDGAFDVAGQLDSWLAHGVFAAEHAT